MEELGANSISLDEDKIQFPLCLRKRREGDNFSPKGMNGRKKTLSKYFKDEKYSLYDKENQWILTDYTNQILWVVGRRSDERFSATEQTLNTLTLSII